MRALFAGADSGYALGMHTDSDSGETEGGEVKGGSAHEARLRTQARLERQAEKLRENLLKRKQQSRARRAGDADEGVGLPASKTGQSQD